MHIEGSVLIDLLYPLLWLLFDPCAVLVKDLIRLKIRLVN